MAANLSVTTGDITRMSAGGPAPTDSFAAHEKHVYKC